MHVFHTSSCRCYTLTKACQSSLSSARRVIHAFLMHELGITSHHHHMKDRTQMFQCTEESLRRPGHLTGREKKQDSCTSEKISSLPPQSGTQFPNVRSFRTSSPIFVSTSASLPPQLLPPPTKIYTPRSLAYIRTTSITNVRKASRKSSCFSTLQKPRTIVLYSCYLLLILTNEKPPHPQTGCQIS